MAKSGEFYTFDEVVRQLHIDENKLKRLVSEGEISAFREGDVMKFRKSEIDKLARVGAGSETSETVLSEITLEDEGGAFQDSSETLTDDLVFEGAEAGQGDQVDLGAEPAGVGADEISSQDTFIEEASGVEDVGMTTEPIDLSADLTEEVEEEVEEAPVRAARRPVAAGARRAAAAAPTGNPGVSFALVLTSILGLLALFLAWTVSNNELRSNPPGNMAKKLSDVFYDMGSKEIVEKKVKKLRTSLSDAQAGGAGAAE
ncbi:MAG: helix-turn-helix domain-containing protein [Planctomycetota bacterium]